MSAPLILTNVDNHFSSLGSEFYSLVRPQSLSNTHLIQANPALAQQLGIPADQLSSSSFISSFSGQQCPDNFQPLAMKYAGHQFGVYNPELGDGRGLLLAQLRDKHHQSWDIHLKGAGQTPYSRFADGRAVLRSSIREYLGGEALHHLGIASTRSLALFGSDTPVQRETEEQAALLVRVSQSHVRFGSFEWFHYTHRPQLVKKLADYVIDLHHQDLPQDESRYPLFLQRVAEKTAEMIAAWQSVGFTHGVMNTDNMSILGDTFDYGPYGFMDDYQPDFVCNHSDHQGRYAFNQQPGIGLWNLNALAHSLSSLISTEDINTALSRYEPHIKHCYATELSAKLGLAKPHDDDVMIAAQWLALLEKEHADYTRSFRALSQFDPQLPSEQQTLRNQFVDRQAFDQWAEAYRQRLAFETQDQQARQTLMNRHNPKYVLRNYLAQKAIELAEQQDYSEIDRLMTLLVNPYDEHPEYESYAQVPPDSAKGIALSCSS
ncbi:MAG: hypothetical protein CL693_13415 [Cellvibrionaceae bacterium]|nr:hypothetical protein [Cellvibrionaceae bacterium]|tara:strand:- start:5024 stop:6493 length:1470 start_codon:yes stop_codon:yes gene_type:complete